MSNYVLELLLIIHNGIINDDCYAVDPEFTGACCHKAIVEFLGVDVRDHDVVGESFELFGLCQPVDLLALCKFLQQTPRHNVHLASSVFSWSRKDAVSSGFQPNLGEF
jgi:hypothetical protein